MKFKINKQKALIKKLIDFKRVDPDPSLKDVYEKKYQRYHQAISALESFWE